MSNGFINLKEMEVWAKCIGGFIINFGASEFLIFSWIEKINGRTAALNALRKSVETNIKTIQEGIPKLKLSDPDKVKAKDLWQKIDSFRDMRNRIAHNPICQTFRKDTGEVVLSVIDVNELTEGEITFLKELNHSKIGESAKCIAELNYELGVLFNSIA